MHSVLSRVVYSAGARWRNPSLDSEHRRLLASERLSRPALDALQLERTQAFLTFAARHSPYYAAIFAERDFHPARLASVRDLAVLPPIDKATLIARNADIHTRFDFGRQFTSETSGTSGVALEFRKDERWDSANRAHVMRGYGWHGVRPWERNGYLWGYDIAPSRARRVRALDSLQNRFRLFRYDAASVRAFAEELQGAVFLSGYSSMIYEVARLINTLGLRAHDLRMVKGTSEMILDAYQPEAERAFGRRIISEYGAAEAGLIAFECPSGRMHINCEDVVLEVGDDGEVLVTNLLSRSFPIIRYRLGDSVKLSDEACPCGRAHPVLAEVLGRRGATVVGRTGRYPALTFYYVFKNLALQHGVLLNYRATQSVAGLADLAIEGHGDPAIEQLVAGELTKYFGDDVTFAIAWVRELPREAGRKAQYFRSLL